MKFDRFLLAAWSALPEDVGRAAWDDGRAMPHEQLAAYALDDAD